MDGVHDDDKGVELRTQLRTQPLQNNLIGYAELIRAASVSRSTIERAWRGPWKDGEPRLPPPGKIVSRAVWKAVEVDHWLLARAHMQRATLATLARENAEDLSPDELEDKALDLIVKSLEQRSGKRIDPSNLALHMSNRISWDEFKAAEVEEFARIAERFGNIDRDRAYILAAWLFAPLRSMFEGADGKSPAFLSDPATLEALGRRAVHNDDWEALEVEWLERRGRSN